MYSDEEYLNSPLEIEKELTSFFSLNSVKVVFDIGACDGLDSIKYGRLFPNSKVYSYEPLGNNVSLINENIAKYKSSNIIPIQIALSDRKGEAEFYVSSGRPDHIAEDIDWDFGNKSSSLLEPNKTIEVHPWLKFKKKVTVNTDTLENFMFENSISLIDFIHMDVQGAELMVLKGAGQSISKIKMIWLEVENVELYKNQPLASDVESFLKQNGFIKIKDTVNKIAGDQLWVNYSYFLKKKITRNLYLIFNKFR
jgi:FkbM family methyltransferase